MKITRRDFLKLSGAGVGSAVALTLPLGVGKTALAAPIKLPEIKKGKETTTICCYCSVGCGAIITTDESGKILRFEGDPDHPISEGALCSKGQAMSQIHQVDGKINPYRLTKPLYRAPNSTKWEEKSWDWMIDTVAKRVKATRDAHWNQNAGRTDAIASLGGGELDNEECYLLSKIDRALGLAYMEHCARI